MELIERELRWGGKTETVYFKELTAGDQVELVKGQKYRTNKEGGSIEVDLGEQLESNHKIVQLTLVNEDGKRVYRTLGDLHREPARKVKALVKLATEVHKDDDSGND